MSRLPRSASPSSSGNRDIILAAQPFSIPDSRDRIVAVNPSAHRRAEQLDTEKAASEDLMVACVARKVLTLFLTLETQFVDVASSKASSAPKIKGQREQLLPLVFCGAGYFKFLGVNQLLVF